MNSHGPKSITDDVPGFRVGFSADFCREDGSQAYPDIGLSVFDSTPEVVWSFLTEYRPEYTASELAGFDVLISLKPRVTAESLDGVTRLCAIGRCGVGYDNVDLHACTERGIAVYITPGGVIRPVAESILLMVLALSHRLLEKDSMVRKDRWEESKLRLGREPRDRVVGTIGLGNIAQEVVRLLKILNVRKFMAFDPYASRQISSELGVELVTLDELLEQSDYVLVNCPLTTETRGLLGAPQFARMKNDAVLINTARGPIVDESAMIEALKYGTIAGAALDVFEREPLPADSPLISMENVILTSHSIAWTEELFRDMGRIDCEGALAIYRGEAPKHVVNPEVLSSPHFIEKLERMKSNFASQEGK